MNKIAQWVVLAIIISVVIVVVILAVLIRVDYKTPRQVRQQSKQPAASTVHMADMHMSRARTDGFRQFRVRTINCNCVPLLRKARLPIARIMHDADIVMLQETWRVPQMFTSDVLDKCADDVLSASDLSDQQSAFIIAPVQVHVPMWKCTDSGLSAVARRTSVRSLSCIAFEPFVNGRSIDRIANKGVAVFQCGPMCIATLHCQATYNDASAPSAADVRVRMTQFEQAIKLAVAHACVLIVGDVNECTHLDQMDAVVARYTHGYGQRIHTPSPTCAKSCLHVRSWQHDASKLGIALDHAWILDNRRASAHSAKVENDTTAWTDHAALSFTLVLHQ